MLKIDLKVFCSDCGKELQVEDCHLETDHGESLVYYQPTVYPCKDCTDKVAEESYNMALDDIKYGSFTEHDDNERR